MNNQVSPEKVYPSKISAVYPEGGLLQKLAVHAFNSLQFELEGKPEEAKALAAEFGVSEAELWDALEVLYTEN